MYQKSRFVDKGVSEYKTGRVHSETLLDKTGCLVIVHRGEEYLLRRTRMGKLMLTK